PSGAGSTPARGGGTLVSAAGVAARGGPPRAGDKGFLVRGRVAGGLCRAFVSSWGDANAADLDQAAPPRGFARASSPCHELHLSVPFDVPFLSSTTRGKGVSSSAPGGSGVAVAERRSDHLS